ncbi:MAG: hypothetical protein CL843_14470 [Crocinitomicaceae bacterium]|nr:hypothetical protein [Crocinitomicaceae bacterium]
MVATTSCIPDVTYNTTSNDVMGVLTFTYNGLNVSGTVYPYCANMYHIEWGDGTSTSGTNLTAATTLYHTYYSVGIYTVTLVIDNLNYTSTACNISYECVSSTKYSISIGGEGASCCTDDIPAYDIATKTIDDIGQFGANTSTGELVFRQNDCPDDVPLGCIRLTKDVNLISNVISAQASLYGDYWLYEEEEYTTSTTLVPNVIENGNLNQWRVSESYTYREELDEDIINSSSQTEYKNYDRGTFGMETFDWDYPENNDPELWLLSSRNTEYSPNGNVLEQQNILGNYSTVAFSWNNTQTHYIAQNAEQGTALFESFEKVYPDVNSSNYRFLEEYVHYDAGDGPIDNTIAHTGENSIALVDPGSTDAYVITSINDMGLKLSTQSFEKGLLVQAWFHIDKAKNDADIDLYLWNRYASTWWTSQLTMSKISEAGEWQLYGVLVRPADLTALGLSATGQSRVVMGVHVNNLISIGSSTSDPDEYENSWITAGEEATSDIHMDDVRIQPLSSEMQCYVYDDTGKLRATFDQQHYATIFQYDASGKLVRKLKETVEGIKTISETEYNSPGNASW